MGVYSDAESASASGSSASEAEAAPSAHSSSASASEPEAAAPAVEEATAAAADSSASEAEEEVEDAPPALENFDDEALIEKKELDCLLLVLEARKLLGSMLKLKEDMDAEERERRRREREAEKRLAGKLSVQEIQEVLQMNQGDDDERDLVALITELKKQLVIEIRRNHGLDRDLAMLDRKIALLIKNRGNILAVDTMRGNKKRKKRLAAGVEIKLDSRTIENYQDLFYMLQTEPRYLARMVYLVSPDEMEGFLETTVLTLYGDAYSPREEYLILQLFKLAIQHEISVIKEIGDFLQVDSVVPKMIIAYNRRKAGVQYLQDTLKSPLHQFLDKDLDLDLNPKRIYATMRNEEEIRTGQRSELERNVTDEEALQNPRVAEIHSQRLRDLKEVCRLFLDAIFYSQDNLPYGLRWICKQLRSLCQKALPDATHEDILKLTGYFVYYRFLNLAIVTPDATHAKIVDKDLSQTARTAVVMVAKVLQNVFNLRPFATDSPFAPMNDFITEYKPAVMEYFDSLVKVNDPEDQLQVNKYMELTHKTKPVIQISLSEIFQTHKMIVANLKSIAPDEDDPLRKVMADLGAAPEHSDLADEDNRDIQLTLTNRFKVDVDDGDNTDALYAATKELLIPILRIVPIKTSIQRLNLMDVLEHGFKFATEQKNEELSNNINKILENISKLEKADRVTKDDNYDSFVHDVALEVINRNAIRNHQKKEIERLERTLGSLRSHQAYLEEQIKQYKDYLQDCKNSFYNNPRNKKGKKAKKAKKGDTPNRVGPFKFKYAVLAKRGIIRDSEIPPLSQKRTTFSIVSDEPGVFEITCKIAGISVEKVTVELDTLLERHYNNIETVELDQITLDTNMSLHLFNSFFAGKK